MEGTAGYPEAFLGNRFHLGVTNYSKDSLCLFTGLSPLQKVDSTIREVGEYPIHTDSIVEDIQ